MKMKGGMIMKSKIDIDPQESKGFDDLIEAMLDGRLDTMYTMTLAKVISFDAYNMRADVQPLLLVRDDLNKKMRRSAIARDLPVMFPCGSTFFMRWPIYAGDVVIVLYSTTSLDELLDTNDGAFPKSKRRFSEKDGIVLGGYTWNNGPRTTAAYGGDFIIFQRQLGSWFRMTEAGGMDINVKTLNINCTDMTVRSSGGVRVRANSTIALESEAGVDITAPTTQVNGQMDVTTAFTADSIKLHNGKDMNTHTHSYRPGDGSPTDTSGPN